MNRKNTKTKRDIPNKETMAALREYSEMKKNRKKYKRCSSIVEITNNNYQF